MIVILYLVDQSFTSHILLYYSGFTKLSKLILALNTTKNWLISICDLSFSADRRGLLWLLDEEAIYPGSSDESFLERLFTYYGDRDHQLLIRKAPGNNQFIIQHLQGTNPVLYSAKGWLKFSRENPISRAAISILQESCK